MTFWSKLLLLSMTTAVVVGGAGILYAVRWQQADLPITAPAVVTLEMGEPFSHFARRLQRRGLMDHPRLWTALARLSGEARRIQAGEYEVRPGDSPATLLSRLVAGDVVTYRIKIVEGWTVMQAVATMGSHPALGRELQAVTVNTLLEVLGLPPGHAEGLFFPDTYQFVRGDSDADILRRAYARMQRVLQASWSERDAGLPYASPYEALIAASLIEKETGREADRPIISQVFALRLHRGMRLQTDPSVVYGIGETFDGNLRRIHLRTNTPYNTYRNRGLPPTPIALPGVSSIEAALHPANGEYLYFVSRGDGTSKFSLSLEEHEEAVRRFQLR